MGGVHRLDENCGVWRKMLDLDFAMNGRSCGESSLSSVERTCKGWCVRMFRRVVADNSPEVSTVLGTRCKEAVRTKDLFFAELIEESIRMEAGFDDSLIVNQSKAPVERAIARAVLLENVGERPVGERIHQSGSLDICLDDIGGRLGKIMGEVPAPRGWCSIR